MKQCESDLQRIIVKYLEWQYPNILFKADLAGVKLTIGSAVKQKRLGHKAGYPDLMIFEPRGDYHGLFLEVKKSHKEIYRQDGKFRKNEHLEEQRAIIEKLNDRNYYAVFVCSVEEAKKTIDNYLKMELK